MCPEQFSAADVAKGTLKKIVRPTEEPHAMKWLNKTRLPEPSIRTRAPDGAPQGDVPPHAKDEHTDKWAVPDEIMEEATPASEDSGRRKAERHLCTTVASRIPAILAESMGLAEEESPAGKTTGTTNALPTRR
jgi:hypothetical protein